MKNHKKGDINIVDVPGARRIIFVAISDIEGSGPSGVLSMMHRLHRNPLGKLYGNVYTA